MTSSAVMTYTSLVEDIKTYAERRDSPFLEQIPRLIMLAENRIAADPTLRGLGFQRYANGTFNTNTFQKPNRWRESISFNITVASKRNFLKLRSYDYCRIYWPNPALTGQPKFYANYDYEHFFVVPTPSQVIDFELAYYERPEPLSDLKQTNWTTQYAPQLILFATLLEAQPFLKRQERLAEFQGLYNEAASKLGGESQRRVVDRNAVRGSE